MSSEQKGPREEAQSRSFSFAEKALEKRSPLASSSASSEATPAHRVWGTWGQTRRRLLEAETAAQESGPSASSSASAHTVSKTAGKKRGHQRATWAVDHSEGTKLRMNRRRNSSYRPEDMEALYRLLEDPIVQSFLEADTFMKVSDKHLLSMVVEYFGRVGLPGRLYNRIHFFLALYIASDMEEDNPTSKHSIFQFLLGKEHWPELSGEFLGLKLEFFRAMEYQAWVSQELCEEIQAQNPDHWVWTRERQGAL